MWRKIRRWLFLRQFPKDFPARYVMRSGNIVWVSGRSDLQEGDKAYVPGPKISASVITVVPRLYTSEEGKE